MKKECLIFLGIILSSLSFAQNTLYFDNFEAYSAGQGVASQSDDWETWTAPSGGNSEDALISTEQAYSNTQSLLIDNDKDMLYQFHGINSGNIGIEFWFYIPDDKGGYFNVQHLSTINWAFAMHFQENDAVVFQNGVDSIQLTTYTPDAWNKIFLEVDISSDSLTVEINDSVVGSFPFHYSQSNTNSIVLDCINFYGANEMAYIENSEMYIDDFKIVELEEPISDPSMLVNYSTIESTGDSLTLSLFNVGEAALYYDVYVVYDEHETFEGTSEIIELSHWDSNSEATDTVFGSQYEEDVNFLVHFQCEELQGYIGRKIERIITNTCSGYVGDSVALIFPERNGLAGPNPDLAEYIHELYTDVPPETEYAFELPTPVRITGEELYFGLSFRSHGGESPMMLLQENEEPEMDDNYINHQGNNYYAGYFDDFYLKAELSGYAWPEWLSLSSVGNVLSVASADDIIVKFNQDMLEAGNTYTAKIVVASGDPERKFIEIPVTLDVLNSIDDEENIGILGYPNPVRNVFHVESESEIQSIMVVNMKGQILSEQEVGNSMVDVQLSDLPAGIYQVIINLKSQSVSKKIVKE
jgi:hypothetical protein